MRPVFILVVLVLSAYGCSRYNRLMKSTDIELKYEWSMKYYEEENSNVHRGVHRLSQHATEAYENARQYVAGFIGAKSSNEIIFTRGTTESVNFLATVLDQNLTAGDEVLISAMEHHSNLVPWQLRSSTGRRPRRSASHISSRSATAPMSTSETFSTSSPVSPALVRYCSISNRSNMPVSSCRRHVRQLATSP